MSFGKFSLIVVAIWGTSRAYRWGTDEIGNQVKALETAKPMVSRRLNSVDPECSNQIECSKTKAAQDTLNTLKTYQQNINAASFNYGDVSAKMEMVVMGTVSFVTESVMSVFTDGNPTDTVEGRSHHIATNNGE